MAEWWDGGVLYQIQQFVPEPSTLMLLMIPATAAVLRRRRD